MEASSEEARNNVEIEQNDKKETTAEETAGAETAGAETAGAETAGAETAGAETAGAETDGAETPDAETANAEVAGTKTEASDGIPDFSLEELLGFGITFVDVDGTKSVEIPFDAQKKLVESVQHLGFGTPRALDVILRRIFQAGGLLGRVKMSTDEKTLTWRATEAEEEPSQKDTPDSASKEPVSQDNNRASGNVELLYENIGHGWTALVQQHYQVRFSTPFPAVLVQRMLEVSEISAKVPVINTKQS